MGTTTPTPFLRIRRLPPQHRCRSGIPESHGRLHPRLSKSDQLAITAAISLYAYGALHGQQNYAQKAQDCVTDTYTNGRGTDAPGSSATRFIYNYHNDSSWGTIFNFFPNAPLDLNNFPASAVSMQCDWCTKQKTSIGIPYASAIEDEANGMWEMWVAATCPGALQETISGHF